AIQNGRRRSAHGAKTVSIRNLGTRRRRAAPAAVPPTEKTAHRRSLAAEKFQHPELLGSRFREIIHDLGILGSSNSGRCASPSPFLLLTVEISAQADSAWRGELLTCYP